MEQLKIDLNSARRIRSLERELDSILARLRDCDDPEIEGGLQADLMAKMDEHQALLEAK